MANRVSNEQLEELLEYLAEHPNLAKGVGLGARSKETVDRQWNDLAMKLNSFGSGSSKTGDRWKKYWADLKYKSKTRLAKLRQDARGTGGGPSNHEDLSEIDRKVLAIIGENAVFGDSQHRVPVFNTQPAVPDLVSVEDENIVVLEDVIISDTELPVPDASSVEAQIETQQVPEPHQTGVENPVSEPTRSRLRRGRNRTSLSSNTTTRIQTRIDPEWVMQLEQNRVQAENKMANAALIMAEAANKIAEASLINAETSRKQLEVLKTLTDLLSQLTSVPTARV